MFLCETSSIRTTLDPPDPLFKHLKTRAAQEGRTLRDLVVELVEKGLPNRLWTDGWLAATAEAAGLRMVTFDQDFERFNLSRLQVLA